MKVKIINKSHYPSPNYETLESAGMDLRSNIKTDITLKPNQRAIVPTGIFIALPKGYEAQIRSRSGLAAKHGVTVLNSPGTIDADYRGEIGVILINFSENDFIIKNGDRIAQIVIAKHERAIWEECNDLSKTERGSGGFGSTGQK
jgi:dUTP pyrophosphatase